MNKCKCCKKDFIPGRNTLGIYCSNQCQSDFQYLSYIDRWKNNLEDGMSGKYGLSNHIRRYLFDRFDSKCSRCDWSEMNIYSNKIPLEIDHIDGNHENNLEDNLVLLCPNCHTLTPTYRGKNKKPKFGSGSPC